VSGRDYTVSGVILTVFVTAGLILACVGLAATGRRVHIAGDPPGPAGNERAAYRNLSAIADAQERYIAGDWDDDGIRSYSPFLAHLWQAVDVEGRPVKTRFISRRLAFATHPALAVDGYYYRLLQLKGRPDRPGVMDYQKEWAVMALPAAPLKTGRITFLCNSDREIFVRPVSADSIHYPLHPEEEGWSIVGDSESLDSFLADPAAPGP